MTAPAPRRSSTSVKPPVDAPTSIASLPSTETPKCSSAAISLYAPREANCGAPAISALGVSESTLRSALYAGRELTRTRPAMIRRCAISRLSASPRRAISASSLKRAKGADERRVLVLGLGFGPEPLLEGCFVVVLCAGGIFVIRRWFKGRRAQFAAGAPR